jgi:4-amino-4-deoxy-L-arabinose transferase-like glycosyltransferase
MKKTTLILGIIILLHLTFVFLSADQLFYGDETAFLTAARDIASGQITGRQGYIDGALVEDKSMMLFHPPTYFYLLSLFLFLFGESTYSVRMVSVIFSIGSIILVYFITKEILKKRKIENLENWALIASFIYAINPANIQNIILIEIDGGLLNFALLLFIYLFISNKSFKFLIPSLFLVFSSKITGVTILFATLFITSILTLNLKETFRIIKLYFITGILFSLIFLSYTKIFNLNPEYLFLHNSFLGVLKNFLTNPYAILRSAWSFKTFFYFTTPFFTFLFIILTFIIIKKIIRKKDYLIENKDIALLFVYSLMIFLFNLILGQSAYSFVKYYATIIAPITILIIYFTPKKIKNIKKALPIIILTSIILLIYFIVFLKDPLMPEVIGRVSTVQLSELIIPILTKTILYSIVPIFLCFGLYRKIPRKKLWLVLLFLLIFTSFYLNILHANADYSTHNLYGDKGLEETIEYLKDKPPEKIAGYIHLCYFLDYQETTEITTLFHDMDKLDKTLIEKDIQYLIIYEKDLDFIPQKILNKFQLEKQIKDYFIFKRII